MRNRCQWSARHRSHCLLAASQGPVQRQFLPSFPATDWGFLLRIGFEDGGGASGKPAIPANQRRQSTIPRLPAPEQRADPPAKAGCRMDIGDRDQGERFSQDPVGVDL
jgi:hypothetical protein